ncbi:TnsD family Tn7-like transposition protein [Gorillibacterium massiliense]|uniref:TnsD family Tn7-like transposition protein n=1 Tax=Gorillibacterium massiliense TaxID=1280390 RepID=UPI0004AE5ECC|nr:TnsD family Tn7-like transposition protein [Gorillibacterium massiliense]
MRLYPDETIYGICSRIHNSSGETSINRTIKRLFNTKEGKNIRIWKANTIWNKGLSQLADCIRIDVSRLLTNHSFYPYFEKFCPMDKIQRLNNALCYGDESPSFLMGHNTRFTDPPLFLCPVCVEEDIEKYGEPYWHRSHQLPGSLVCYKHNVRLVKECRICNEEFKSKKPREFVVTPLFCSTGHYLIEPFPNESEGLLTLARENNAILNTTINFSLQDIQTRIRMFAKNQGYINVNSNVVQYNKLYLDFLRRFPINILNEIDEQITDKKTVWIKKMFYTNRFSSRFPVHYVMVMIFFKNSFENFLQDEVEFRPFGEGPWQCKNITCPKYESNIITDISYRQSKENIIGKFQCPICKFSYTKRAGPSITEEESKKINTVKETGPLWDKKLEELLQNDVIYIKSIAKELNVGVGFITARLRDRVNKLNLVKSKQTDTKRIQRGRMKKILTQNPELTRAEADKNFNSVFYWLFINDRDWLDEVLPIDRQPVTYEQRRDKMHSLITNNPKLTRNELRSIDITTYEWLLDNDRAWMESVLPPIRARRVYHNNYGLDARREAYLQLKKKYPDYNRTQIFNLDPNNYRWLRMNDMVWLDQHQPPRKSLKRIKLSIEERRTAFISIFDSNPNASRKDLKRMCGSNYSWLERRDKKWFRTYLPLIMKQVNTMGRYMSKEQRREIFLNLRNQNPHMTRTQLSALNNANYSWLQKSDKQWLNENAPPIRTNSKIMKK